MPRDRTRWTDDDFPPALLLIVFVGVAMCMPPHNDTWWHLRSGLEMTTTGGILTTDRLSYTVLETPLYHNHEWLTQLLFYGLFRLGGPWALTLACAVCTLAAALGSWRLVKGSAEARFCWLAVLLPATVIAWAIRPQVISLALFVLALHLATSERDRWLPLLCVVWANLHAVAVTGVVIAGCAALDAVIWSRPRAHRSVLIFLLCALAPVLTPLGWEYWPRVLQVVRLARELQIQEYRSAFASAAVPFWGCLVAFVVIAARSGSLASHSRSTRVLAIVAAVFAVAGVLSVRNIPMFVLAGVPAMSQLLPLPRRRANPKPVPVAAVAVGVGVAVVTAGGVAYAWRDRGAHLGWSPISSSAIAAIRECDGPLFNGFADGGALTWFVPDRKVFIDSRGVEAYPLELLLRSRNADVHGQYRDLFQEFGIGCAAVQSGSIMATALSGDPEMREAYSDAQWRVFARRARQR